MPVEKVMAADLVAKFERLHVKPAAGRTLIVGSRLYGQRDDRRACYPNAVGVDMLPGPGVDIVANLESASEAQALGQFDHIECLSVLEHSRAPWKMAANLEGLLRTGGTFYLSVPFIWRPHGYPDDYWRFTMSGVVELFPRIGWASLMYAHTKLTPKNLVAYGGEDESGCPLMPRTQVLGFGARA